jgi:hypothetical protein
VRSSAHPTVAVRSHSQSVALDVVVMLALTRALPGVLALGVAVLLVAVACVCAWCVYGGLARPIIREIKRCCCLSRPDTTTK